jgi:uncharacterized OB-fold protein
MTFFEKQTDPTAPMHWQGNMQADYLYPSGISGDKFFKHIMKNETFIAAKCPKCKKTFFPPRIYCEDCFIGISEKDWIEIPAVGKVKLFTIAIADTNGVRLEEPKVIGMIDIEETDGAILGIIKIDDITKDILGIRVEAVFKTKSEREGTIKDILYFKKKKTG